MERGFIFISEVQLILFKDNANRVKCKIKASGTRFYFKECPQSSHSWELKELEELSLVSLAKELKDKCFAIKIFLKEDRTSADIQFVFSRAWHNDCTAT